MIQIPEPIALWLEEQTALAFVLNVGAVLGLLWALAKLARRTMPSVKRAIEFIEALFQLPDFMRGTTSALDDQAKTLAIVKHEVLPNSGGSLRDEVTTQGLQMEKIEAKLAKDHDRFEEIERHLEVRRATRKSAAALTPGGIAPWVDEVECADSFNPYPVHDERETP